MPRALIVIREPANKRRHVRSNERVEWDDCVTKRYRLFAAGAIHHRGKGYNKSEGA